MAICDDRVSPLWPASFALSGLLGIGPKTNKLARIGHCADHVTNFCCEKPCFRGCSTMGSGAGAGGKVSVFLSGVFVCAACEEPEGGLLTTAASYSPFLFCAIFFYLGYAASGDLPIAAESV